MNGDVHAIERRLREDPDDELSWQVYGDWLLAQGDARGELIALEQRGYAPGSKLAEQAAAMTTAQMQTLGRRGDSLDLEWRYGFVIAARETSLEYPYELAELAELCSTPAFRLLSRLSLSFDSEPAEDLSKLEGLAFMGARDDTVSSLSQLSLPELRGLELAYSEAGDALATSLAQIELTALRELDLRYCALTSAGLRALLTNESLRALRRLHLQGNRIDAAGVVALASSPLLEGLELLDLRGSQVRGEGARALARSPHARNLRRLHLDRRDLQDEGLAALAASTQLRPELVRLWRARGAQGAR